MKVDLSSPLISAFERKLEFKKVEGREITSKRL